MSETTVTDVEINAPDTVSTDDLPTVSVSVTRLLGDAVTQPVLEDEETVTITLQDNASSPRSIQRDVISQEIHGAGNPTITGSVTLPFEWAPDDLPPGSYDLGLAVENAIMTDVDQVEVKNPDYDEEDVTPDPIPEPTPEPDPTPDPDPDPDPETGLLEDVGTVEIVAGLAALFIGAVAIRGGKS